MLALLLALGGAWSTAAGIAAAEPNAAEIDTARKLYKEALERRKVGDEAAARTKLQGAYALTKSAVIGVELAKCELALGKLIDAREQAIEVEGLPVTAKETKASTDARAEAARMVKDLEQRIAFVVVRLVDVTPGTTPSVTLDGAALPLEALGLPRSVDPGKHVVAASIAGGESAEVEVLVVEAETREVSLSLAARTNDPVEASATPTPKPADPSPRDVTATGTDEDRPDRSARLEVAARAAYGLPTGRADSNVAMSDAFSNVIPIWVDAGLRLTPETFVGGYFSYGVASVKSGGAVCPSGASGCSAHDVRVGLELLYHVPSSGGRSDPWLGVGVGYEWLTYDLSIPTSKGTNTGSETIRGFELLNLQAGYDYRIAPSVGLGPFVSFSLAKYTSYSYSVTASGVAQPEKSGDIDDGKLHQWLLLGVRGALRL
jgi:hypothetical protein